MEISEALTVVGGRTEVGPTKTYARRSVGIPRSIVDDLAAYLAQRATAAGGPLGPDDYVFTAPRGGPLRRDLLFKRILRPAIDAANLPPNLRLHDYADVRVMPTFPRTACSSRVDALKLSA
jgi:hypothetical protein